MKRTLALTLSCGCRRADRGRWVESCDEAERLFEAMRRADAWSEEHRAASEAYLAHYRGEE